jgi:GNAT superfamily N-acetyltransferase
MNAMLQTGVLMLEVENLTKVRTATTDEEIRRCYQVMHQLRPHLDNESVFVEQVQRQIADGYHLVFLEDEEVIALAGFRFLEFLAWGKVLYVDDLITCAKARKSGHGNLLIDWLIKRAKEKLCDQLHLDSGPQRHDAHRLYIKNKMKIIGHHFALDLNENH